MRESRSNTFGHLPVPRDYFTGFSGLFEVPPREVLAFYRGSADEAIDYGKQALHHRFVLCLCLGTAGDLIVEDRLFSVRPNGGLLIFPHQPHHFARFGDAAISWLFISFELNDETVLRPLRNTLLHLDDEMWGRVNQVVQCYQAGVRGEAAGAYDIVSWLSLLFSRFIQTRSQSLSAEPFDGLEHNLQKERVRRIAEYVHRHLDRPLPLADLASHMACSESLLRKEFRESVGVSIGRFIRRARILKACQLLHTSELSVTAIAEQCGFTSLFSFSRAFKQLNGISPLAYRRHIIT